jgi:Rieske Fe-S protein
MTELNESIGASLDRRRMLQVVGAAGAAGVLAACGGGSENGNANSSDPEAEEPDGNSESELPDDSDESNDGDEPDGAEALAATSDVPVGGGVIGAGVVITQPAGGDFRAFSSTCTHQGCTVSDVSDGIISCPCHGSQYSAEDGSVERGPATAPLPPVAITVDGDQIVRS